MPQFLLGSRLFRLGDTLLLRRLDRAIKWHTTQTSSMIGSVWVGSCLCSPLRTPACFVSCVQSALFLQETEEGRRFHDEINNVLMLPVKPCRVYPCCSRLCLMCCSHDLKASGSCRSSFYSRTFHCLCHC